MLKKVTLDGDEDINEFFKNHPSLYLVKYILYYNTIARKNEHHIIYSLDTKMMQGQHLQKGRY